MKQKNVPANAEPTAGYGDCYTFTAIDPETKLMLCWLVGFRTAECTDQFMADLAPRLTMRVQLTTDGMSAYPAAIAKAFGSNVDYAVLNKTYSHAHPGVEAKRPYSPAEIVATSKSVVDGNPDINHVSTLHVERANLSMRMNMRRFTRLTNSFSKKLENHMHAISFYFMVYNFVKIHSSVRTSPAMAAGVATTLWELWDMKDIVMMADTMVEV